LKTKQKQAREFKGSDKAREWLADLILTGETDI
jgi:hypothetical protein